MHTIITVTFNADGGKLYDYLLLNPSKNKLDRKKPMFSSSGKVLYYVGYTQEEKLPSHVTSSITLGKDNYITLGGIPVFTSSKKKEEETKSKKAVLKKGEKKYKNENEFWNSFFKKINNSPTRKQLAASMSKIDQEEKEKRKYREERGLYPVWL